MPNSTLPPDNYLGDPERTTGEFQDQINNLQNWVNALQAELQALSGTTVREGAVRDVGTTGTQLRQADTFGSAADVDADQDLQTTDTVQFGRVTDAATPGDGDFDSDKLGYWEATVDLGNQFAASAEMEIVRIGRVCFFAIRDSGSSNFVSFDGSQANPASGANDIPSNFRPSTRYKNTIQADSSLSAPIANIEISGGEVQIRLKDFDGNIAPDTFVASLVGSYLV